MVMCLENHVLFQGWAKTELRALLAESSPQTYKAGETIFERGHYSTGFYLIDEGQVQLQLVSPKGVVKKFNTLHVGESVGEAYMLMDKPYRIDAVALSAVHLTKVPQQAYFKYLGQQPNLMRSLVASLSERLYLLLGDVLNVRLHSGTQRVICYLLGDLSLRNGARITLDQPKAKIAAALNLTPEHFSRILNDLSSRGFIGVEGRHIEFLDIEGLFSYER